MADIFYNKGREEIASGVIDLLVDTIKVMLVVSDAPAYTPNADDLVVDNSGTNDPVDAELNVTGYTRGWGGAGRQALGTKTIAADNTNDRAEFDAADLTWSSLGTGQTIAAAIMIKEGGANDTTSRLIAYFDITDTPTNGSNFTINWSAEGLLHF